VVLLALPAAGPALENAAILLAMDPTAAGGAEPPPLCAAAIALTEEPVTMPGRAFTEGVLDTPDELLWVLAPAKGFALVLAAPPNTAAAAAAFPRTFAPVITVEELPLAPAATFVGAAAAGGAVPGLVAFAALLVLEEAVPVSEAGGTRSKASCAAAPETGSTALGDSEYTGSVAEERGDRAPAGMNIMGDFGVRGETIPCRAAAAAADAEVEDACGKLPVELEAVTPPAVFTVSGVTRGRAPVGGSGADWVASGP